MRTFVYREEYLRRARRRFYRNVVAALETHNIRFMVGGALALGCYTGVIRDTKDVDIFVLPQDIKPVLSALRKSGFRTELTDDTWLGKAFKANEYVDIIFSSMNGLTHVDEEWFKYARLGNILGCPVKLNPPEEMVWMKAFIMGRDRFDGADIMRIIFYQGCSMDWERLDRRFAGDWQVLLSHLVMFTYVYPGAKNRVPPIFMRKLTKRFAEYAKEPVSGKNICRGKFLSLIDYGFKKAGKMKGLGKKGGFHA